METERAEEKSRKNDRRQASEQQLAYFAKEHGLSCDEVEELLERVEDDRRNLDGAFAPAPTLANRATLFLSSAPDAVAAGQARKPIDGAA